MAASSIESVSTVHGALPVVIVVVSLVAVVASFRWKDGVWKQQILFGVPIAGALVAIAAILVDGLALIPYQFPNSYYLWVGLVLLALAVGIIGWTRFRNWRRAVSVLSVVLTALSAVTLINAHYQYYPTVGALFGVNAQNEVSQAELRAERKKRAASGVMPTHGYTVQVKIPPTASGFQASPAYVWLPPAWVANEKIELPVIELISGSPGGPADWTRGGFADETARVFANAHNGVAPILVMPDQNGLNSDDTECVDSSRGNAETYLTKDVPAYIRQEFGARTGPGSWAIGGLSMGGMCALMLTLRHPELSQTFADYSGLTSPTVDENVDPDETTRELFGGSSAAYNAHDPLSLLNGAHFPSVAGWFEVGTADSAPLDAQQTLVPLAQQAGIEVCSLEVPGGEHDFDFWAKSFRDSLPWLSHRLGVAPAPVGSTATCGT